jgi:hypothetical protein
VRSHWVMNHLRVEWNNVPRSSGSCCLLEPLGTIPPAEAEANFYAALEKSDMAA